MRRLPKIHKAAEVGDVAAIKVRLATGDNVDRLWLHGYTPLHHAAHEGHVDAVRCLLAHGADPNWPDTDLGQTALHSACVMGRSDCTRELVAAGANVNVEDSSGNTPIIDASGSLVSQPTVLQLLAHEGAEIAHRNSYGSTALHEAARVGNEEHCLVLIELGADPAIRDDEGFTADDIALLNGHVELCQALRSILASRTAS